jgi:hypothetical protein
MKLLNESVVDLIWQGVEDLLRFEYELPHGAAVRAEAVYGKFSSDSALPPAPRAFHTALFLCAGGQEERARLVGMKGSERSH